MRLIRAAVADDLGTIAGSPLRESFIPIGQFNQAFAGLLIGHAGSQVAIVARPPLKFGAVHPC